MPRPATISPQAGRSPQGTRSPAQRFVLITRNQWPRPPPHKIALRGTLERFLESAGALLQLPLNAKLIYNENGAVVRDLDHVQDGEVLFVSCGEPFVRGSMPQPMAARPRSALVATQAPRAESPRRDLDATTSARAIETQAFQRAVAGSMYARGQNWRLAVAAVYDGLSGSDQERLPRGREVRATRDMVEESLFMDRLASEGIVGHPVGLSLEPAIAGALNGVSPQDIRLVVMGPAGSGKSSVLAALSVAIIRKLQLSSAHGTFLVMPLRFEQAAPDVLARHLCAAAFDAIPACSPRRMAAARAARAWFFNAAFGVSLRVPAIDGVKMILLVQAAEAIKAALAGDEFGKFCAAAAALPFAIASAFGFEAPFFVIDCASQIDRIDAPGLFSRRPLAFSEVFLQAIVDHEAPFVATGLGEPSPFVGLAGILDVTGIIPEEGEPLQSDDLVVRPTDCGGAPGLVANFRAAREAADASAQATKQMGLLPKFMSAGSKSLCLRAGHEFSRLYRGAGRLARLSQLGE